MSVQTFRVPGVTEEGFLHLSELRKTAARLQDDEFFARYPVPALVVAEIGDGALGALEDSVTGEQPLQLLTVSHEGLRVLRYLDRVAFLAKRPGNPFPHFVSIGRSATNDVVVAIETISKLHGYFTCTAGRWAYTDHGSTNGSQVNGTPLASAKRPLEDGDRILLGLGITVEFLMPETLLARVRTP